jgi:glycyl-radical enzyme activating protein
MAGRVFDIQRFCIQDGPGIRTTVFLKGCFLHCKWCHNPESINPKPQLSVAQERCISCHECEKVCPEAAIGYRRDGKVVLDWARCNDCGACAPVCDAKALEIVGRDVSVEEVLEVVLRDRDYYAASGGGMTLSGGEPLFQPDFAEALFRAAKAEGLHNCVETSGFAEWRSLERLLPVVDLFLYDYKETDPHLHQAFTGARNEQILANLRSLHRAGANILLRCPMIPEYNARKEHLNGIAAVARELTDLKGVEILPYHRLGRAKLQRFGLPARMPESVKPPGQQTVDSWITYLKRRGVSLVNQSSSAEATCEGLPYPCKAASARPLP